MGAGTNTVRIFDPIPPNYPTITIDDQKGEVQVKKVHTVKKTLKCSDDSCSGDLRYKGGSLYGRHIHKCSECNLGAYVEGYQFPYIDYIEAK